MDVNELASSLLAVGDLVREANQKINGDRATVSVRVRADFKKSSFDVALLLDQTLIEHAKAWLLPGIATAVVTAPSLIRILFGSEAEKKGITGAIESVLDIWKKLKGEKPKEVVNDPAKGMSIIVIGDGNTISADPNAALLYGDELIRRSISGVVRPVTTEGIDVLDIRKDKNPLNRITKIDLPLLPAGPDLSSSETSQNVRIDRRPAIVRVTRPNLEEGKWGFSDGAAKFSAEISDESFKKRVNDGDEGFFKGDTLDVILSITQTIGPDGTKFQTKYEIEKVIDHKHAARQQNLQT